MCNFYSIFLVIYKKELFKVRQNNIVDYMNFIHEKKGKKKNVFIFSSGPSLNEIEEIKKKNLAKNFGMIVIRYLLKVLLML